jgi:hypothetical protein
MDGPDPGDTSACRGHPLSCGATRRDGIGRRHPATPEHP